MSCAPEDNCYLTGVNDGYAAALKAYGITEKDEDDEDYEDEEETERMRLEEEEEKRIRLDKKAAAITAQKQKVADRNAQKANYEKSEQIKREGKGRAMPGPFGFSGGRSKRNPDATKKRKAKITKKRSKSAKKRK
jgi:hypothetical protein